jgi:hypothetical protein
VTVHELKTTPDMLALIWSGEKTAELRWDDRDFQEGDLLWLREWSKETGYAQRFVLVRVTHALGNYDGLQPGFAMLSFTVVERGIGRPRTPKKAA